MCCINREADESELIIMTLYAVLIKLKSLSVVQARPSTDITLHYEIAATNRASDQEPLYQKGFTAPPLIFCFFIRWWWCCCFYCFFRLGCCVGLWFIVPHTQTTMEVSLQLNSFLLLRHRHHINHPLEYRIIINIIDQQQQQHTKINDQSSQNSLSIHADILQT